jgi:hypothetical protein
MPKAGDRYAYGHPDGAGLGEMARGGPLDDDMKKLDLKDGQEVKYLGPDADSGWPMIEWRDALGIARITTIEPAVFEANFQLAEAEE